MSNFSPWMGDSGGTWCGFSCFTGLFKVGLSPRGVVQTLLMQSNRIGRTKLFIIESRELAVSSLEVKMPCSVSIFSAEFCGSVFSVANAVRPRAPCQSVEVVFLYG